MKPLQIFLITLCVFISACTKDRATPEMPLGKSVYKFDYEQVTELVIAKNDPTNGDHWTLRVTKSPGKSSNWMIASGPENSRLVDTTADGNFILHLLDTLRTLQPTARADEGALSSFGLERPLFSLKWTTPETSSELFIGDANPKLAGAYALFGVKSPTVYVVQGAALVMLTHLENFSVLRKRRLFTFEADDIDQLQIRGQPIIQRAGDRFVDHAKRQLPVQFSQDLEQLAHAQIFNFIDDADLCLKLTKWLDTRARHVVSFSDRQGLKTVLKVGQKEGKTYGSFSSRPGAVFELYSKVPIFFTRASSPKSNIH